MAHHDGIPLAQPGPIGDPQLCTLRDCAYAAHRGEIPSRAEAEALLAAIGPLFDELIQWRTAYRIEIGQLDPKVIFLEDHRPQVSTDKPAPGAA
ncbi:hypothetical protein [Pseudooceanicola algae]|uniref:Uncharacterized protein n=1 Tax=Pseudooceanicola algae TaxID=1537215 RepID=A0A418SK80_9RHOB|nr:hypothetical protein [Pseudooceanicola algae]QPM89134.1 hypothetical protein PSAL_003450 [Pseudooceanicola algae]